MFSKRVHWTAPVNELTRERRKRGDLLDLTETNPTRAGIAYPHEELADALARGAHASYDPDPRGLRSAREALAIELQCEPDDLLLTSSTSEAYSFLFKLLCDPGDAVLTATPSYPLLEHLAQLELVQLRTFAMEFHRRWELHLERRALSPSDTRAIVVVNPNNPTGSFVTPQEQDALAVHGVPIISDEVFLPYPLDATGTTFVRDDVLTFTLGGLSKSAGLPHFKLAWIRVSGPGKREALDALELIADNFLSVATPVQVALPELLRIAPRIRDAISARTRANLATLRRTFESIPSVRVLPVEGGWSAVIRLPRTHLERRALSPSIGDEGRRAESPSFQMASDDLALALLDRGVVVQPGYFFDFESEGHIVVSLLTREDVFAAGVEKLK